VYRAELLEVLFEQMLGRLTAHSADLTRVAAALPADFLFAGLEFQRHGFAGPQPGNRQQGGILSALSSKNGATCCIFTIVLKI
jgi:hypothetical protein